MAINIKKSNVLEVVSVHLDKVDVEAQKIKSANGPVWICGNYKLEAYKIPFEVITGDREEIYIRNYFEDKFKMVA